jgi:EAL domain-containing protein (putative c-di-GMP-specific phosphodiesterase class I)
MSVNLSAGELAAKDLVGEIRRTLAEVGLDPATFVLEMTERVLMSDTEATVKKLEELRRLGVRFWVDDFGTGFSSLSYLRRFPIDALKIARPFLDGIPKGEQETALVRGILELGHNLDLEVVAEGVERKEQLQALREMGCDLVQGFLLARPQGSERIEKLLEGVPLASASKPEEDFGMLSPQGILRLGPAVA